MRRPDTIVIEGRAYSWRALVTLRKAQLDAWRKAQGEQPALFEFAHDCRPKTERTAAPGPASRTSPSPSPVRAPAPAIDRKVRDQPKRRKVGQAGRLRKRTSTELNAAGLLMER